MNIVLRSNYGDESIALIQWFHENKSISNKSVIVCSIDTGWEASSWGERVVWGEALALRYGFKVVRLKSPMDFLSLMKERGAPPNPKNQWCAGFLKGIPFIDWMDQVDLQGDYIIAIPKRQALYRKIIPEYISECEFHGYRKVWHPLIKIDSKERNRLLRSAGVEPLNHRSLECEPCVNACLSEIKEMSLIDLKKADKLENELNTLFYPQYNKKITIIAQSADKVTKERSMDSFSMGCGDPFGCGL